MAVEMRQMVVQAQVDDQAVRRAMDPLLHRHHTTLLTPTKKMSVDAVPVTATAVVHVPVPQRLDCSHNWLERKGSDRLKGEVEEQVDTPREPKHVLMHKDRMEWKTCRCHRGSKVMAGIERSHMGKVMVVVVALVAAACRVDIVAVMTSPMRSSAVAVDHRDLQLMVGVDRSALPWCAAQLAAVCIRRCVIVMIHQVRVAVQRDAATMLLIDYHAATMWTRNAREVPLSRYLRCCYHSCAASLLPW